MSLQKANKASVGFFCLFVFCFVVFSHVEEAKDNISSGDISNCCLMKLSDCTKEPSSAKACSGDFIACLSLHRTACSHVFKFLYKSLAYLKMNAQIGRFRRQRKQECITPCILSISTTHDREDAGWSFFVCCWSELFLAKPMAFSTSPVLQKVRQRGEGCRTKGTDFSLIYHQMLTVFAEWTVPQWTALILCLMSCRVLSVFLFSPFLDPALRNSSYIDVNLGSLTYQALW